MSDAFTAIEPDALFVVACPVCQGQVAALGSLCGRDACCPLCASLFRVPRPSTAAPSAPSATPDQQTHAASPDPPPSHAPATSGIAEDWGGVITKLAPVRKHPEPAPISTTAPADFELPAAVNPTSTVTAEATDPPAVTTPVAETPAPEMLETAIWTDSATGGDTAEVIEITDAAPPLREPPRREGPQAVADENLPGVGGTPLDPKAADLAFSEPVRTIRHGNTVIEIRRLTPEERHARRVRRNILMIVVGVSILLMVVILLGVGGGRR